MLTSTTADGTVYAERQSHTAEKLVRLLTVPGLLPKVLSATTAIGGAIRIACGRVVPCTRPVLPLAHQVQPS